ncbi:hypothetical protein [Shewanella algae]|uniref:hypothetical protein n=1 Tax=Shewanella algae TaxID=38313 RepID=UPI0031F4C29C
MKSQMETLHQEVISEIGDFFSGFERPGEPENAEQMNFQLQQRINACFELVVNGQGYNGEVRELTAELFAARAHIELLHDAINKGDLQTAQLAAGEFANDESPFGIPGGDE